MKEAPIPLAQNEQGRGAELAAPKAGECFAEIPKAPRALARAVSKRRDARAHEQT